jgi:hypothetical protein
MLSVALMAAWLAAGGTNPLSQHPRLLSAGSDFTIGTAITAQPACTAPTLLYPGTQRCLTYSVTNNLGATITVQSLTLALDPSYPLPAACSSSNLDLTNTTFSGSYNVGAHLTKAVPAALTIALRDTGANQDGCKNFTFHFLYSGTAIYTHVYATSIAVTSTANPSTYGTPVTFTATVTTPGATAPNPPTGSAVFKDGSTTLGTATLNSSAQASYTTSSLGGGSHTVTAAFNNTDGNFSTSTSSSLTQVVNRAARPVTLASSLNPSNFGLGVTFTATVGTSAPPLVNPTGSVKFSDGTKVLATVPVNSKGQATLSTSSLGGGGHPITAAYSGDANFAAATSNTVTQQVKFTYCITSKYNNSLIVLSGQSVCITSSGSVNGNITVNAGGALSDIGGPVNGNIASTGATAFTLCGVNKVNGAVTVQNSTGFVLIGDNGDDGSPGCAGNTINSNVTVSGNSAGVEIGGNAINGTLTVNSNTGGGLQAEDAVPEVENNSISGSLGCTGNNPAPSNDGQKNSVKGSRTGQCAGF